MGQENGIDLSGPLHDDRRVRGLVQKAVEALNAKQASYSPIKKFAIAADRLHAWKAASSHRRSR